MKDPEELMTIPEIVSEVKVARRTVYDWLRSGQLSGLKAGRQWRVRRREVSAFLEQQLGERMNDAEYLTRHG